MKALVHNPQVKRWIGPNNGFKLKLITKKLRSGKFQVKFFVDMPGKRALYGYILAEDHDTLRGVVEGIISKLHIVSSHSDFRHMHLYSIQRVSSSAMKDIIIF